MFLWVLISAHSAGTAALTQEQTIAKLQLLGCSLTRGSYAKIEAGIQNISVQELLAMKEVFHADFEDFFQKQPEE